MSVTVYQWGFRFGTGFPLPLIRGFSVIAERGEFMRCRQGDKEFIIEEFPNGWRLYPWKNKRAHRSQCIFVPKDS